MTDSIFLAPRCLLQDLSEDEDFLRGDGPIRIVADEVEIVGRSALPGRSIAIFARRIVSRDGALDVSGAPASQSFDPAAKEAALNGAAGHPNGKPGADGGPGPDGGAITIVADTLQGALTLRARGSDGGSSQSGGDGWTPPAPNGVDGKFEDNRKKANYERGEFGTGPFSDPVYVAYGAPGGDAKNGGNAGAPGTPGKGGKGGAISLRCVDFDPAALDCEADPGSGGRAGAPGQAGAAGPVGRGGRHRVYWKRHSLNPFGGGPRSKEAWADDKNEHIKDAVKDYLGGKTRAADGTGGSKAGAAAEARADAPDGEAGSISLEAVERPALAKLLDPRLFEMTKVLAERALAQGRDEPASERLAWLRGSGRASDDDEQDLKRRGERTAYQQQIDEVRRAAGLPSR